MDRRSFITMGMAAALSITLVSCGDDDGPREDSGVDASADATVDASADATDDSSTADDTFEGSTTDPHSHTVEIRCADLGEDGVTYTSSENLDHTHEITLTGEQLAQLAAGETVVIETTDQDHTHEWTITKPEEACL